MKLHIHQSKKFNVLLVLNNEAVKKTKTTLLMFGMKWLILSEKIKALEPHVWQLTF